MMIANLIVLLIILACVGYQYQKGKMVSSFATFISLLFAAIVAFAFFEPVAGIFISRGGQSRFSGLLPWTQTLSFVLLLVLVFAILQTVVQQLTKSTAEFNKLTEKLGCVICGILLGLVASGLLLTAAVMSPLPGGYPYPRFDQVRPDPSKPRKPIFNPDGFVTGLFSLVSRGSLSGRASFAVLHPDFLDQAFLNRLAGAKKVPLLTTSPAITLPPKSADEQQAVAVWPAPTNLKTPEGKPVPTRAGCGLIVVRFGIRKKALREAGIFTPSQLRLICKPESYAKNPLAGKGRNLYPLGYFKSSDQIQITKLTDTIRLTTSDFGPSESVRWMDFVFYLPNGYRPVLLEFKQNEVVMLPPLVSADQAPAPSPFETKEAEPKDKTTRPKREDADRKQQIKRPTKR